MSIVPQAAETRRYAILRKAANALRPAGSGSANIRSVIDDAGLSHQEVIDEFGDRDSLVVALAEMFATSMLEPLDDGSQATFHEKLVAFGNRVMEAYSAPQMRGLYRIAIAAASRNCELASAFYARGPDRVTAELARFFRAEPKAGIRPGDDGVHVARSFMAALRARFDPLDTTPPDDTPASLHGRRGATRIVELFCAGIQKGAIDASVAR